MKKIFSLITCLALIIAMLASCEEMHPIDELKAQAVVGRNMQIDMTLTDVPLIGNVNATAKIDGNKLHLCSESALFPESYTETTDTVAYSYVKDSVTGDWLKTETEIDTDLISGVITEDDLEALFNSQNYTLSEENENIYTLNSNVEIGNLTSVTFTVEEEGCTINATLDFEGVTCTAEFRIHSIGKTEVTLPFA